MPGESGHGFGMIGSLSGIVAAVGEETALIEVGGVGYVVSAGGRTLGRLSVGAPVRLYIETHVREDAIRLFGFAAEEERAWFAHLQTIPGVGAQVATGIVASVPDPKLFKSSRQFAAWLGLTPRQYTTGGHIRLGRITKRGDKYLRMLLVHGARSVVAKLKDKPDRVSCWVRNLLERRGYLRTVVALAARNARLIWTLLMKQEDYQVMPA